MGASATTLNGHRFPTVQLLAEHKRLAIDFLKRDVGLYDYGKSVAIPYYDAAGVQLFVRSRTTPPGEKNKTYQPKGVKPAAYGRERIHKAHKAGYLHLVEGESDCWAFFFHDLPALGIPGCSNTNVLEADDLVGINKIFIHREPGQSGDTFLPGVQNKLAQLGYQGQAFELRMPDGIKDASDLHSDDPDRFKERLEECCANAKPLVIESQRQAAEAKGEGWEPPSPLGVIPAPVRFPIEVLPSPLRPFVEEVAWALPCPPDFVAIPMLAIGGGAAGNARRLSIKSSHSQSASIFAAFVARPGSGKSPALDFVRRPLEKQEARWYRDHQAAHKLWRQEQQLFEELARDKRHRAEDAENLEPEPTLRRAVVDNCTMEAFPSILLENPRGLSFIMPELTALTGGLNQYKMKGNDKQTLLNLWDGAPIRIDRKGQAEGKTFVRVPHPFGAIVGALTPSGLKLLRGETNKRQAPDDGFLDRFLFAYPEDVPAEGEGWKDVSQDVIERWDLTVKKLLNLKMVEDEEACSPWKLIYFTPGGKEAWKDFTHRHAAESNAEDFPDHLRGPWAKMKGYQGRLALILHLLEAHCQDTEKDGVDEKDMGNAEKLINYFKAHAKRIYLSIDADPRVRVAQKILAWVERKNRRSFKRHEPHNDIRNMHVLPCPEDLDEPLELLEQLGYLRQEYPELRAGKPGRRPGNLFVVNPLWIRQINQTNQTNPPSDGPEGGFV
jgi:Protein of unknown function (DUF3987)